MTPASRFKTALADSGPLKLADAIDEHDATKPKRPLHPGIEPLIGIDDLASILGVSRRWLERERSAGRVPKPDFTAGRCPRWRPETVRRWIEGGGRL